jgi:hypothetical protein
MLVSSIDALRQVYGARQVGQVWLLLNREEILLARCTVECRNGSI